MMNVFVYGTLMKGQRAERLLAQGKYLGKYMLKDYAMYKLDYVGYPGIVEKDGECVVGEVYANLIIDSLNQLLEGDQAFAIDNYMAGLSDGLRVQMEQKIRQK